MPEYKKAYLCRIRYVTNNWFLFTPNDGKDFLREKRYMCTKLFLLWNKYIHYALFVGEKQGDKFITSI